MFRSSLLCVTDSWIQTHICDLIHQQGCFTSTLPTSTSQYKTVARFYTYCYLKQALGKSHCNSAQFEPSIANKICPQSKTLLASSCNNSNTTPVNIRTKAVTHVHRSPCNLSVMSILLQPKLQDVDNF